MASKGGMGDWALASTDVFTCIYMHSHTWTCSQTCVCTPMRKHVCTHVYVPPCMNMYTYQNCFSYISENQGQSCFLCVRQSWCLPVACTGEDPCCLFCVRQSWGLPAACTGEDPRNCFWFSSDSNPKGRHWRLLSPLWMSELSVSMPFVFLVIGQSWMSVWEGRNGISKAFLWRWGCLFVLRNKISWLANPCKIICWVAKANLFTNKNCHVCHFLRKMWVTDIQNSYSSKCQ